jgi:hypothetical protein
VVLAHPVFVFVGLISYALYLWHWPLLSFAHILGFGGDPTAIALVVAASLALAIATYFLIECPIRYARASFAPPALVAATGILAIVGASAQRGVLFPRLHAAPYQDVSAASSDWDFPKGLARVQTPEGLVLWRNGQGPGTVLYLGDSQMQQYWPRASQLLAQPAMHRPVVFVTGGGCAPIPGLHALNAAECHNFTDQLSKLASDSQISTVVISASWLRYFDSDDYQIVGYGRTLCGSPGWDEGFRRLDGVIRAFTSAGKSVWLVLGMPIGGTLGPINSVHRHLSGETHLEPLMVDRRTADVHWEPIRTKLREVAASAGARTVDPFASLCGRDTCLGRTADGTIIYMDANHLARQLCA